MTEAFLYQAVLFRKSVISRHPFFGFVFHSHVKSGGFKSLDGDCRVTVEQGIEQGLKALVQTVKTYDNDFESLYNAVVKNENFKDVSREKVKRYFEEG